MDKPKEKTYSFEGLLRLASETSDKEEEEAAYRTLGILCFSKKRHQEAIQYLEKSLRIALETSDKEAEGTSNGHLGVVYQSIGKYQDAIKYHERSLSNFIEIGIKKGEGEAYARLGEIFHKQGKYHDAIRHQEKCLEIAIETNDKKAEGTANGNLGAAYQSLAKYDDAMKYQQKRLNIVQEIGDRKGQGVTYGNLGIIYHSIGKYNNAIESHEKRLSIALEMDDKSGEGAAYGNLGVVYQSQGKYEQAIEYQEKRLRIALEIGDKNGEAAAYANLGANYQSQGKYRMAIEHLRKYVGIAKEMGDKNGEGTAYENLGVVYSNLGSYEVAIRYQKEGLRIAKEIGDKKGEEATCGNLGVAYRKVGKYEEAIKYQKESLRIAKEIGDKKGEGVAYGNLGSVYSSVGEREESIKCFESLLIIAAEIGDKKGQGMALGNLGAAYYASKNYKKVKEYQQKLLNIAIEIGDKKGEASAYGNLGAVYQTLGENEEAEKCLKKLLQIAEDIGDKNGEAKAYGNLGVLYQSMRNYQEAIKCYERRTAIAKKVGDKNGEGITLNNLGFMYLDRCDGDDLHENMNKAASYFREALQCFEWLIDHLKGQDQFKISILDKFIKTYQALTQVLITLEQNKEALLVSEHGRARALADRLASKYSLRHNLASSNNLKLFNEVETLLSKRKSSILLFALYKGLVSYWILSHQKPLAFHQEHIEELKDATSGEKKNGKETFLGNIVEATLDDMKLREPVECEDRTLDLLGEDEQSSGQRNIFDETEDDSHPLEVLYDSLINPVKQHLTEEEIVIIPDGVLLKVPFAALRIQDANTNLYLSDTYRIRLAPSLAALKILQESPEDYHSMVGALVVGNPAVEEVIIEGKKMTYPRLVGAQDEAVELGKLIGVTPLIGTEATKEVIKQKLREGVGVVHIASHGNLEGKILLAPCRPERRVPEEEDCMLTMTEVQETGCRAKLVVLSCCHSGRGRIRAEGVVGLTRAFLAAGARAVVASLWAIEDKATKEFMLSFYTHLKNGESASASLQQAMKEMRKRPQFSHPRYWAAFFLIGDDVTINI